MILYTYLSANHKHAIFADIDCYFVGTDPDKHVLRSLRIGSNTKQYNPVLISCLSLFGGIFVVGTEFRYVRLPDKPLFLVL
jgi:hypothetical protein